MAAIPSPAHPLAATLARIAPALPRWPARLGPPDGPGWTRYDELLDETVLRARLADAEVGLGGGSALATQTTVGRIAGPPVMLMAAAVFTDRRLPVLDAEQIALRWTSGEGADRADAVAFDRPGLLVLPGDPAVAAPGVSVVPDVAALQAALTAQVYRLFEPLVDAASVLGRRGRRALWQAVADRVAVGFLLTGKHVGQAARARAETDQTLAAAPRQLRLAVDWLPVEHGGTVELFKRKSVCCLYYKALGYRDVYCSTCPLIPREESVSRLQARLADRDAAG
jgi:hypothetical protein